MTPIDRERLVDAVAMGAGALFLVSLPIPHTVGLRLTLLGLLVALALLSKRILSVRTLPAKIAISIWVLAAAASLWHAVDLDYSMKEIKNEIGYALIAFMVFYVLVRSWTTLLMWRNALLAIAVALSLVAVYWRIVLPDEFRFGPFGGAGSLITLLVTVLPLLLAGMIQGRRTSLPFALSVPAFLILLAGGWATQNRMFWVLLPVIVVVFGLLACRARRVTERGEQGFSRKSKLNVFMPTLVAVAIVGGSGALLLRVNAERLRVESPNAASSGVLLIDERPAIWAYVVKRIAEAPATGYGFGRGALRAELAERFDNSLIWHAHNLLLNYGLQMGITGPFILLLLFGSLGLAHARLYFDSDIDARLIGAAGATVLIAFFGRSMVDDFFYRHNALLFWALNGMLLGWGSRVRFDKTDTAIGRARA